MHLIPHLIPKDMGTIYLTFLTPMDCGFSLWATATDCGWEVKYIDPQRNRTQPVGQFPCLRRRLQRRVPMRSTEFNYRRSGLCPHSTQHRPGMVTLIAERFGGGCRAHGWARPIQADQR